MINLKLSPACREPDANASLTSPDEALPPRLCARQRRTMKSRRSKREERTELGPLMRAGDTQATAAARLGRTTGTIAENWRAKAGGSVTERSGLIRRAWDAEAQFAVDAARLMNTRPCETNACPGATRLVAAITRRNRPNLAITHTSYEFIYRYVYAVARGVEV